MAGKPGSDKLKKYLIALAQDASVRHAHLVNPEDSMKRFKLSKKHRDMINYGDVKGIQDELGDKSIYLVLSNGGGDFFRK